MDSPNGEPQVCHPPRPQVPVRDVGRVTMGRPLFPGVLALCCGALLACGPTPALKHARIVRAVSETNTRHEQAVLSRFLRGEQATLLEPRVDVVEDPGKGRSTYPHGRVQSLRFAMDVDALERRDWDVFLGMGWEAFLDEMRQDRLVEGMTPRGEPVLLKSAETDEERNPVHHYFARSRDGRLLLLKTVRHSLRRHRIVLPYTCDRMPIVEAPPEVWRVLVIEGHGLADLKEITLRYEGEDIAYDCAHYTY